MHIYICTHAMKGGDNMEKECCKIIVCKTDEGICLKFEGDGIKDQTCCVVKTEKDGDEGKPKDCC